jgi:hypothetical protein
MLEVAEPAYGLLLFYSRRASLPFAAPSGGLLDSPPLTLEADVGH